MLEDIVDGLFHIAKADGALHEKELAFLTRVADVFGMSEQRFRGIMARHVDLGEADPYEVLGVSRKDDFATIRKRYRVLASENHPDRLAARGVPVTLHRVASDRMAALNAAYEAIARERKAA